MLKRMSVVAFAAAISLASVATIANAQEPPKGATPGDTAGASSGGSADKGSAAAPMTKKSTAKKHSKKKSM